MPSVAAAILVLSKPLRAVVVMPAWARRALPDAILKPITAYRREKQCRLWPNALPLRRRGAAVGSPTSAAMSGGIDAHHLPWAGEKGTTQPFALKGAAGRPPRSQGLMFWLSRKRFCGSYVLFTATRRSCLAAP